jgi:anti-anti-sigma factor
VTAPAASRPPGPDPDDLLWVVARPADGRGRAVVEAVGEVDDYTAPLLASCLHGQSARAAVRTLVVDLSRVRLLSAAGVAALEEAAERCARRGARMRLRTGNRPAGSLHAMRARGGWGTRTSQPGSAGPPTRRSR